MDAEMAIQPMLARLASESFASEDRTPDNKSILCPMAERIGCTQPFVKQDHALQHTRIHMGQKSAHASDQNLQVLEHQTSPRVQIVMPWALYQSEYAVHISFKHDSTISDPWSDQSWTCSIFLQSTPASKSDLGQPFPYEDDKRAEHLKCFMQEIRKQQEKLRKQYSFLKRPDNAIITEEQLTELNEGLGLSSEWLDRIRRHMQLTERERRWVNAKVELLDRLPSGSPMWKWYENSQTRLQFCWEPSLPYLQTLVGAVRAKFHGPRSDWWKLVLCPSAIDWDLTVDESRWLAEYLQSIERMVDEDGEPVDLDWKPQREREPHSRQVPEGQAWNTKTFLWNTRVFNSKNSLIDELEENEPDYYYESDLEEMKEMGVTDVLKIKPKAEVIAELKEWASTYRTAAPKAAGTSVDLMEMDSVVPALHGQAKTAGWGGGISPRTLLPTAIDEERLKDCACDLEEQMETVRAQSVGRDSLYSRPSSSEGRGDRIAGHSADDDSALVGRW